MNSSSFANSSSSIFTWVILEEITYPVDESFSTFLHT